MIKKIEFVHVFLGIGTNLGNRQENISLALQLLSARVGNIVRRSTDYFSEAWGFSSENQFLNIVAEVETRLSPEELLAATQQIEREMGRTKKTVGTAYADRIIDIDILLYDNRKVNLPNLTIPHPLIQQRDFVRIPLEEVLKDAKWSVI